MPGSRTHDILTITTGVFGLLPGTWILLPDHNIAAAFTITGAHLVSGMAFSPDLDLDSEHCPCGRRATYQRCRPAHVLALLGLTIITRPSYHCAAYGTGHGRP